MEVPISSFNWLDEYKIGNLIIDKQHEHLFELANRIIDPYNDQQTTYLNSMALHDYINTHFKAEESLMEQCNYPDYKSHKEKHKLLTKKFDRLNSGILTDETIKEDVVKFMADWILVHILHDDMHFQSFLNSTKTSLVELM